MTGEAENRNQIDDLIIGHFDRTLNEEQEMELADALTSSGEAKETFLSYMRMEGRLHSMGRDGFLREPPAELAIEPERPAPQPVVDEPVVRSDRQRLRLIAASTSLVVCAVVILMLREINILRAQHSLSDRTNAQAKAAILDAINTGEADG